MAHGLYIDSQDKIWLADHQTHLITKHDHDGEILLELGIYGYASITINTTGGNGDPFNNPTGVALSSDGKIFVSDGYGNRRVHRFSDKGVLEQSWGEAGINPGQFSILHKVGVDLSDNVYICDRENDRIQFTDQDGEFMFIWDGFHQPTDIAFGPDGEAYVSELQHRISILDSNGNLICSWADVSSSSPGDFIAPHGIAIDSSTDIYVGEVLEGRRIQKFIRQ